MTGGALGSIIAQVFHLSSTERKTLLVAGAAAGMSATFAAPLSAVLLAVELLLFEWKPRSLIPVALASAAAVPRAAMSWASDRCFRFPRTPCLSDRKDCWVVSCRHSSRSRLSAMLTEPYMRRRIYFNACRFTGRGGRRSADW